MLNLETAEAPQKLRRIAIEPLTRVEGHGKVTILLDAEHRVHQVRLHIVEFRGFEAFIEGRPYWEVPVTVQRLCGICPVSHHLAAAKARLDFMQKVVARADQLYHQRNETAASLIEKQTQLAIAETEYATRSAKLDSCRTLLFPSLEDVKAIKP